MGLDDHSLICIGKLRLRDYSEAYVSAIVVRPLRLPGAVCPFSNAGIPKLWAVKLSRDPLHIIGVQNLKQRAINDSKLESRENNQPEGQYLRLCNVR